MEFNELKELIELFSKSDVDRLKLEVEGFKLALGKKKAAVSQPGEGTILSPFSATVSPGGEEVVVEAEDHYSYVESPIVGTYYRSPNPSADPFVKVGDSVSKGQTLCIVEAMKLMNEIQAEISGVVAKILVENGEGVEFGQKLFAIKPH